MTNKKRNPWPYLVAFLIPVVLMLILYVANGIWPFGDRTFLRMDMYHQYVPFMKEFALKLQNGESLLYSWDIGGGVNFAAYYAYYLASPLNWITILCPEAYILEFTGYMVVIKTGLASLAFAWYLMKHCKTESYLPAFFGIFYGMSGYMAAYSWNIMWLDCILLFPLIVYGLEQLVHEKKGLLYCITLGLSILSNYYISIMICIFMVLYFGVLLLSQESFSLKETFKKIGLFTLYSLLAGGFAACVLLPEVYALQHTASADTTFPKTFKTYFSMVSMLARHLPLVESETGLDHWPNIYCGIAVISMVPLYVLNRRYSYKEKIGNFALLLFFLASFAINVLNYIWHGFHYPNSLPCRQSFIYIFLVLVMSYKGVSGIMERSLKQVLACVCGGIGFIMLAEHLIENEQFPWYCWYVAIIFLGIYGILAYLYRKKTISVPLLLVLTLSVGSIEASVNMVATSINTVGRSNYKNQEIAAKELLAQVHDGSFYRVEHFDRRTKNDGAWLGFHSASTFSSTSSAAMTSFYKDMGMEASTNAYCMNGASPLAYAMMNVEYLFATQELTGDGKGLYQLVDSKDITGNAKLYLYANEHSLPLGYVMDADVNTQFNVNAYTPFDVQNSFSEAVTGKKLFNHLSVNVSGSSLTIEVPEAGYVYAYVNSSAIENVTASHGSWSDSFSDVDRGFLLNLGYCETGETIYLSTTDDATMTAQVCRFDTEVFAETCEELSKEGLKITEYTSDSISGTLKTDGGIFVTSIPYDKGWTMKVDGVTVVPEIWNETFLSFTISGGTHSIELSYYPEGLQLGFLITGGSVLVIALLAAATVLWRKRQSKKNPVQEIIEEAKDSDDSFCESAVPEEAVPEVPKETPSEETTEDTSDTVSQTEDTDNKENN